jgi:hypothetical protein
LSGTGLPGADIQYNLQKSELREVVKDKFSNGEFVPLLPERMAVIPPQMAKPAQPSQSDERNFN